MANNNSCKSLCLMLVGPQNENGVDSYSLVSICYHQQTSSFTIVSIE